MSKLVAIKTRALPKGDYGYIDASRVAYELTIEDPKIYTKPVTNSRTWVRMKPDEELLEYWCMENNKDLLDGHLDHLRDSTYRKYFGID